MSTKLLKNVSVLTFILFSLGLILYSSAQAKLSVPYLSQSDKINLPHLPNFLLDRLNLAGSITLNVDTTLDSNLPVYQACTPSPNDCTLRGAISRANSDTANMYTISLPSGIYTLEGFIDDDNNTSDLDVKNGATIAILGTSSDSTIIQAATAQGSAIDRVFQVFNSAFLYLENVTIRYGRESSVDGDGGGIFNDAGTVILYESQVISNTASNGGGIFTENGTLSIENTTISSNSAVYGGGIRAHNSTTTISASTFVDNYASYGGGGLQIYGVGITNIVNSTLSNNQTDGDGGGIYMISGDVEITNSTLSGSRGGNGGGLIFD